MANITASEPAYDAASVTPSDTTRIGGVRGLYIGGAGDVKITTEGGSDITFSGVVAGSILPIRATRVYATGTTADNIIALL